MPVVGNGTITRGVSGQAADAAESPLGLFDALLQLAAGAPALGTGGRPSASNSLFNEGINASPAPSEQSLPAQAGEPGAGPVLLADLLDTLAALELAAANGTPVDAALEGKAAEALDALAALLGIPVSQAPTIDPAIRTAAGGSTIAAVPDALATIEAAATAVPAGSKRAVPGVADVAASPITTVAANTPDGETARPADAAAPVAAPTSPPAGPLAQDGETPAQSSTPPSAAAPESRLSPAVKDLAEKLTRLAAIVEQRAPALAQKLTALAEKLGSADIDPVALARLGLDPELADGEVQAAITRLLAPAAGPKPSPAPAPFTVATLALPDPIVTAPKPKPAAQDPARPAEPTVKAARDAEPREPTASQARIAERPDRPNDAPPQRSSFTPAPHSAAAVADAGPSTQPANATALPPTAALAAETKAVHAAYSAPVRQINIPQVAFEIVRQVSAGASRFQIRLDPPELGRIDVKLDVDAAGNVNARLTVERAETLDLMQRDQRALERALAQAGLDSSKTNLEFSLRQNPFAHQEKNQGNGDGSSSYAQFGGAAEADEAVPAPHIIAYRGPATAGGVNMFV